MLGPRLITAQQIAEWASNPSARYTLPELVRLLVKATVPRSSVQKIDFPAHAEADRPGYDGTTVVDTGTEFVPAEVCFWELGCDKDYKKKARDDYHKRVAEHRERVRSGEAENLSGSAYIAVTPRKWNPSGAPSPKATKKRSKKPGSTPGRRLESMADWEKARTKDGIFREVRAYDSNRLEHWLQEAPAVALWFLEHGLKKPASGLHDIRAYWGIVSRTFRRPLPPGVFLTNREEIAEAFKEWIGAPARELIVKAASAWELTAVFAAWVQTLDRDEQEAIVARTVVVEAHDTWRSLANLPPDHPLILIAAPSLAKEEPELFVEAVHHGHHVLRYGEFLAPASTGAAVLSRLRRYDLQQALEKAGLNSVESARLAGASGGSLTIMRRCYPGSLSSPGWSKDARLAHMLLAAAWEDTRQADQRILEQITGNSYPELRDVAVRWQMEIDPPVRLIRPRMSAAVWEFLSPLDAWDRLSPFLSSDHLAAFEAAAMEVLGEENPALDLPPDERPMASVKGKMRRYSSALRGGIAEILALGATRNDESDDPQLPDFPITAAKVVRKLLIPGSTWKRWASLGGLLSSLAEAAPQEFLAALERDLASASPQVVELLRQEVPSAGVGGAAYHSGLLWALEAVAWSGELMPRATAVLAKMASLDPGGTWSNRPIYSVTRVFFSWRPHTVAAFGERVDVLSSLCRSQPEVAWRITLGLLPQLNSMCPDNSKPTYRDWAAGWTGNTTWQEHREFIDAVVDLAIGMANLFPARWLELIEPLGPLFLARRKSYQRLREALTDFTRFEASSAVRGELWEVLRKFVEKHRSYQNAKWSLPLAEVEQLTAFCEQFRPDDIVRTSVPLFNEGAMLDGDRTLTFEQRRERRAAERRAVLREIWSRGGMADVLRLAGQVRHSLQVGWSLGEAMDATALAQTVPSLLDSEDGPLRDLARGYAAQQIQAHGHAWAMSLPDAGWSTNQRTAWALEMPFAPATWDWIDESGPVESNLYWQRIQTWGGWELDMDSLRRVLEKLRGVGRFWGALDCLHGRQTVHHDVTPDMMLGVLEDLAFPCTEQYPEKADAYHVHEAFAFLQEQLDKGNERLAKLEYAFLPYLDDFSGSPVTLHWYLAKEPEFFVQCLEAMFRPRRAENDNIEKDEEEDTSAPDPSAQRSAQIRAENLYHLLHNWRTIPGTEENGKVSLEKLRAWVERARGLARQVDRGVVADIIIGEVFAQSPMDADGGIPLVVIRQVIEECASEKMESGFYTGLSNQRGVVTKALYEGGQQERDLAAIYGKHAKICAGWPRTAGALRDLQRSYQRQARQADDEAEAEN